MKLSTEAHYTKPINFHDPIPLGQKKIYPKLFLAQKIYRPKKFGRQIKIKIWPLYFFPEKFALNQNFFLTKYFSWKKKFRQNFFRQKKVFHNKIFSKKKKDFWHKKVLKLIFSTKPFCYTQKAFGSKLVSVTKKFYC